MLQGLVRRFGSNPASACSPRRKGIPPMDIHYSSIPLRLAPLVSVSISRQGRRVLRAPLVPAELSVGLLSFASFGPWLASDFSFCASLQHWVRGMPSQKEKLED